MKQIFVIILLIFFPSLGFANCNQEENSNFFQALNQAITETVKNVGNAASSVAKTAENTVGAIAADISGLEKPEKVVELQKKKDECE